MAKVYQGESIQKAINMATAGEVVLVNGDFVENLNLGAKTVTLQGDGALIKGELRGGVAPRILDLTVKGADSGYLAAAVQVGQNAYLERVSAVENSSEGIQLAAGSEMVACLLDSNGIVGFSVSVDGSAKNIKIRNCVSRKNGIGWPTQPKWWNYAWYNPATKQSENKTFIANGRYMFDMGWHGGGAKISYADTIYMQWCEFYQNFGPGFWFDCYDRNILVEDCYTHDNTQSSGKPGWWAAGAAYEICYNGIFRRVVAARNAGGGIQVWESDGLLLDDCTSDGLGFRALAGRSPTLKNIQAINLKLTGTSGINWNGANAQALNLRIQYTQNNATPAWSMPTTPPVTPPPVVDQPPAIPDSPEGTTATPGSGVVQAKGFTWSVGANKKIRKNDQELTGTNSVDFITIRGGELYQRADVYNAQWRWNGSGWDTVTAIPGIITGDDLNKKVAELQIQVSDLQKTADATKAALDSTKATSDKYRGALVDVQTSLIQNQTTISEALKSGSL